MIDVILKGDVKTPRRATLKSVGYDFYAPETIELKPGEWTVIDTGVCVGGKVASIKVRQKLFWKFWRTKEYTLDQWFMLVLPRSGLGNKYGFRIRGTGGVIDQDYMGTIKLTVTVDEPYTLEKDERMAQGIITPFATFDDEIPPEKERNGGHGSSGRF